MKFVSELLELKENDDTKLLLFRVCSPTLINGNFRVTLYAGTESIEIGKVKFFRILSNRKLNIALCDKSETVAPSTEGEKSNEDPPEDEEEYLCFSNPLDESDLSCTADFKDCSWKQTEYDFEAEKERDPILLHEIENQKELIVFLHIFPLSFWKRILDFTNENKKKLLSPVVAEFSLYEMLMYILLRYTMASNSKRKKMDYWATNDVGIAPSFNFGKYMSM